MLVRLATKRDTSGNRYYLIIDHEKKIYSRQPKHWLGREDYIEISKKDERKYVNILNENNYKEIETAL